MLNQSKYNVITQIVIMKIDIIKIGNSQGIRIPKTIMEQCGFSESVEIDLLNNL